MALVKAEAVYKRYALGATDVLALDGVSATVEAGEFLAIAGPSGSGKSTLLNIIGCIDTADAGTVCIDGVDVAGLDADALADLRARRVGFIFQTFNLLPVLSAQENVEYPLLNIAELGRAERRERAEHYLQVVGLADKARHRPNQLSGGQRQRVAIARALATQPRLVLADEPTANLDQSTGREVLDLMQRINRDTGTTFVFSTHDRQVMDIADRLLHMVDGRLRDDGAAGAD